MIFRGFQPHLFRYYTNLTYSGVPKGKYTSRSTFPNNLWIWVLQSQPIIQALFISRRHFFSATYIVMQLYVTRTTFHFPGTTAVSKVGLHTLPAFIFLSLRSPRILLRIVSGSANDHPVDLPQNLFHSYFNFRKILTLINMPRDAIWKISASFTNA